jgi:hypothetical protein
MFFKKRTKSAKQSGISHFLGKAIAILPIILFTHLSYAEDEQYLLELKPQECVSLYKGQTCHLRLEFTFMASKADNYCLYIKDEGEPLTCWEMRKQGTFSKDFNTDKEVVFELRRIDEVDAVLSSVNLFLSWVYQVPDKKRAAWRLF